MDNSQYLAVIDSVESALKTIEEQGNEVIDFETDDGYRRAKELRKPLVRLRNDGDKARLAATKWHRDEQKRINAMWSENILPRIEAIEKPLVAGIKAIDEERKRIEQEKIEAEKKRVQDIHDRIMAIRNMAGMALTLDDIDLAIKKYANLTLESFEEFADDAGAAIAEMDTALSTKKKQLEEQAVEAKRLEEQRKEQERIAAEQRKEQERIDAVKRAIEKERRDAERKAAIEKARQEEAEKAERERKEAAERAEAKRIADIKEAEERAARKERERVEREKAEAERLAAMEPDVKKLIAWRKQMPTFSSVAGRDCYDDLGIYIDKWIEVLRGERHKAG